MKRGLWILSFLDTCQVCFTEKFWTRISSKSRICDVIKVYAKVEKVTPLVRMKVTIGKKTPYLVKRMVQLFMHHARQILSYRGICTLYPRYLNDVIPRIPTLTVYEIWYRVWTQLIADGVPLERLKGHGPLQLLARYRIYRRTFWDECHLEDLPSWQYDPLKDGAHCIGNEETKGISPS